MVKLSDLPEIIQLVNGRVRIQTQAVWFPPGWGLQPLKLHETKKVGAAVCRCSRAVLSHTSFSSDGNVLYLGCEYSNH